MMPSVTVGSCGWPVYVHAVAALNDVSLVICVFE